MLERPSMLQTVADLPHATSACSACGAALPPGKSVCPACGAAHGEGNRCPHCTVVADVEPHPALGFKCRVCGGPRVALDAPLVALGSAAQQALRAARREQTKHVALTAAGLALGGVGALGLLVALVVVLAASPGLLPSLAALFGAGLPLGAGLVALQRAAAARALRTEALHTAQLSALADVQRTLGPLDSARAAEILRIDAERAELLLAEVSVNALLGPGPEPRLRVEAPPPLLVEEPVELEPHTQKQRGQTEIESE